MRKKLCMCLMAFLVTNYWGSTILYAAPSGGFVNRYFYNGKEYDEKDLPSSLVNNDFYLSKSPTIGISDDGKTIELTYEKLIYVDGVTDTTFKDTNYFDIGGSSGVTYTAGNGLNISDNNEISISNIIGKNSTSSHA